MIELKLPWKLVEGVLPSDTEIMNAGGDLITTNAEYFTPIVHRVNTYDQLVEALSVLLGDTERSPNKFTREERIAIGRAALEAAKRGGSDE